MLDKTIQWLDNLVAEFGLEAVVDQMPNDFGGREELRALYQTMDQCENCGAEDGWAVEVGGAPYFLCSDCQDRNDLFDQYGTEVPEDLVVLRNCVMRLVDSDGFEAILRLDWYKVPDTMHILVSWADLWLINDQAPDYCHPPEEIGLDLDQGVDRIADSLHRGNLVDGWYHA
jgi:hypothetical protein